MTPRARQIVERRKQRNAEVSARFWQDVQHRNEESRRATAKQPRPQPDYAARYKRAVRKTP